MISVAQRRQVAGITRLDTFKPPGSRVRAWRALAIIESLWRYGIEGNLARLG